MSAIFQCVRCKVIVRSGVELEGHGDCLVSREVAESLACAHANLVTQHKDDKDWHPRLGCLDCGDWLEPVRIKKQ